MLRAKWTPPAREDLKKIGRYIGRHEHRPSVAAKILREIKANCDEYSEAFARGSVIGSEAAELGEGCRIFSHRRWVIVFEPIDGGIEVFACSTAVATTRGYSAIDVDLPRSAGGRMKTSLSANISATICSRSFRPV